MAEGSLRYLMWVSEGATPGTSPTTGYKYLRNNGGAGISVSKQTLVSKEYRQDRMIPSIRHGNETVNLDFPFELTYADFDAMLEGALFGTFTVGYALTALTVTVVAGTTKTFTCTAATFVTSGVKVGDRITTSGFAAGGNNGEFLVSTVTETVITCATATGLEAVSDDTGVAITTDRYYLKQGVVENSFSFEEGFTDIDEYQVIAGALCNSVSLNVAPNAMATGTFNFLGLSTTGFAATSIEVGTPTDAGTTDPFDSYTGSVKEGGATIAILTGITINIANGLENYFALFDADSYKVGIGRANVTGSISAFFETSALADKFLNETASSLEFTLTDTLGNSLKFLLPKIKYTGATKSMSENNVMIDLPFQAYYDSTEDTTIRVDRNPI